MKQPGNISPIDPRGPLDTSSPPDPGGRQDPQSPRDPNGAGGPRDPSSSRDSARNPGTVPSRFDAIVVGGGPAGLSAAYIMSGAGLNVACLERGDWSGSKNMMGGVIFSRPAGTVVPDFWKEAPLERHVTRREMWLATADSAIKASFETTDFAREPYNSFTVYRSRFDKWLAAQAAAQGAYMVTETLVEGLLWEGGRVIGVRTDRPQGDLEADVVLLAEGVNSFLTEKAGLGPGPEPQSLALAVKEVLALPREKIEDRFDLETGAGASVEIVGETTGRLPGTGFIYTNRDTISIGVGVLLNRLIESDAEAYTILEQFKQQPQVRRLIQGASVREYAAHLIPEGGYCKMPRLFGDGVLVAGDCAGMVNAINSEGANLAMLSGRMAAETIIECHREGCGFDGPSLKRYRDRLEKSLVLKDLKKYEGATPFLQKHQEIFNLYPELLAALAREFFTVDDLSKADKERLLMRLFRSQVPVREVLKMAYDAWRSLV